MEFLGKVKPETSTERISVIVSKYDFGQPLLGKLIKIDIGSVLPAPEDGFFIVGRVVDVRTVNKAIEDPFGFISAENFDKNSINYTSAFVSQVVASDTPNGGNLPYLLVLDIEPITAFRKGRRDSFGYGIPVGAKVELLSNENFNLKYYVENAAVSLGKEAPPLYPIGHYINTDIEALIDFSDFKKLGEALHSVIAGQTGSGKSTLAQLLLAGYGLSNPDMKFIILDTVGEFRDSFRAVDSSKFINLGEVFDKSQYRIYSIPNDVALDRWEIWEELVRESRILEKYFMIRKKENVDYAIKRIEDILKREELTLDGLYEAAENGSLTAVISSRADEIASATYKDENLQNSLKEAIGMALSSHSGFLDEFKEILRYFDDKVNPKIKVSELVSSIFLRDNNGARFFVLDMTSLSTESMKKKVLSEIFDKIYDIVVQSRKVKNANTLIVLEEAHNWAPRRTDSNGEDTYDTDRLSNKIVKSYKELRKFGIGLMAITTRLSGIKKEIFEHSRVKMIGTGLLSGADAELLKSEFGDEIENIYKSFGDPRDPLSPSKQANFLISGPITLLSRSLPEFITVYNNKDDFLKNFQGVLAKKNGNKESSGSVIGNLKIDENSDIILDLM
jgi:energy-coupling factor transporter ATP-binding protein EcfA2